MNRKIKKTQENKKEEHANKPSYIVGTGASAGGLEAFSIFLKNLPHNTDMAFVFIQHLSPGHESILSALLARDTVMPVYEAKDGMEVKGNTVYVIPPGTSMFIQEGILKLVPRKEHSSHMPVDYFFRSLAKDQKNKAIGIILSGTASDGTLGLSYIKEEKGLTFAQEVKSARYDGMPRSAILSGTVDFILPPDKIAMEISKIASHSGVILSDIKKDDDEVNIEDKTSLRRIFQLLRNDTAVDFSHYKPSTIKRRLARRMTLNRVNLLEDYFNLLISNQDELKQLGQDFLINVTSFFREPETFRAIKEKILPLLVNNKNQDMPFRVWIPGCSTGEEAYSMAIVILEYLKDINEDIDVNIFATDISNNAIEKARAGLYPESIAADISPVRLRRFFIKLEGTYQISKTIRNICIFARQNIVTDPPFSHMNLISCRNVLIYLEPVLQKKVIPVFHYALKPDGVLVLGSSETTGNFSNLFSLKDKKYKFYSKKFSIVRKKPSLDFSVEKLDKKLLEENNMPAGKFQEEFDIKKEADRIILNHYAPAGFLINDSMDILEFRGNTSFYLEPVSGPATLNLMKMVREDLQVELRIAIHKCKKKNTPISRKGLKIKYNGRPMTINMDIIPIKSPGTAGSFFCLVLFTELEGKVNSKTEKKKNISVNQEEKDRFNVRELEEELLTTKEYLQSIIEERETSNEELRSALEEIQSSNEELQSTNEELETAKEELQSTNEELTTVNEELQQRNNELTRANNDLMNILNSVDVAIIMLDQGLCIRKFTPKAAKVFNLISADEGRPLSDLNINMIKNFEQNILEVLDNLNSLEYEVQDRKGYWYSMTIKPYKTIDNKIDGVVIALVQIDEIKQAMEKVNDARLYAEAIIETIKSPLLILDRDLRVKTASSSFYNFFQTEPKKIIHRYIYNLGLGEWDIPSLKELLEEILPENKVFENFELKCNFPGIGCKNLLMNGREIYSEGKRQELILLAIEEKNEKL